ncbi:WYL domain-containing protein [Streptomyces sp. NPDC059740]|uniref:WYL domain-containing protein n=1 Tax=Streptomyces sp. NPDC059740 TaxID=3346926 RepID=UPI003653D8C2
MRPTNRRVTAAAHRAGQALAHTALGTRAYLRFLLETGRRVRITYTAQDGETTTRVIDPTEVRRSKAGDWYVRAHDLLRDAGRSFRLDRITAYTTA